jgi:hypothetical protein
MSRCLARSKCFQNISYKSFKLSVCKIPTVITETLIKKQKSTMFGRLRQNYVNMRTAFARIDSGHGDERHMY